MPGSAMTDLLASYVPRLIQKRVAQNSAPIEAPYVRDFQVAVLFADISGFTRLTEGLAEKGPVGVEKLARILNDYFGQLIDLVYEYGGDVVKFAGDAVIAVWSHESGAETSLDQTQDMPDPIPEKLQHQRVLRAAECALKIHERLLNYKAEETTLYLKFSLGAGRVWESHIGGVFNRWEFVLVGDPMVEIGIANRLAKAGDIIVAPSAWKLIREDCDGETMEFPDESWQEKSGQTQPAARLERLKAASQFPAGMEALQIPDEAQAALRPYIPSSIISRISAGQSDWLAELRKVTILFVNLPGMGHGISLEAAQQIMRVIQKIIYRFEGSLNKISQDDKGVMIDVAFGLPPLAHANDPVRGVQAALMLSAELNMLGVRGSIGLTTGRVFCGSVGTNRRREYTFLGNSVNLAARLMSLALQQVDDMERDSFAILCDRPTYEAARERAEFEVLPPQKVKGRSEPVDIFRPLRGKQEAMRAQTELIGRRQEKSELVDTVQAIQRGTKFQVVILLGEAGIGKSRLMDELVEQAGLSQIKIFSGAGDAIEKSNPYFAWRSVFNRLFGIEEIFSKPQLQDADRSTILDAVTVKLEAIEYGLVRYLPLLNVVLPISVPENEFTSAMTSEVRGGNIRDLLVRLLQNEADRAPLLVALEDLHWLDSASWILLSDVVRKVRPLLLAVNTRPLPQPVPPQFKELSEYSEAKLIKLDMMPLDEVEQLVCQRLGVKSMPPEASRLIREKSEGHPFFAEELAYALRDSGVILIEGGGCRLAPGLDNLKSVSLPDNLEAAITSRIDGLNPSQQLTLKVASVIGRIFALRMLHAIYPIEADKPVLDEYLSNLTRMSLTLIESEAPDMEYIFKHAVTQEVAYNLMLYSQRRHLHQAVAEWIENSYENEISAYYALLAYHWVQATNDPEPAMHEAVTRKAASYLEKAGNQSLNNFANAEAAQYFQDLLRFKDDVRPSRLQLGQWYRKLAMAYLGMGKILEARDYFLKALETLGQSVPASSLGMIGALLGALARQTSHRLFPKSYRGRVTDPDQEAIRIEIVQILQDYVVVLFLIGEPNPLPLFHGTLIGLNTAESIRDTSELAYMYAQMGAICGFIPARSQYKHYMERWRELNERFYNPKYFVGSVIALATVESGIGAWKELHARLEKVIEICASLGDQRQAGEALSFLSCNSLLEGNVGLAQQYHARMLENVAKRNNTQTVWYHQWSSSLLLRMGKLDETLESIRQALAIMEKEPIGDENVIELTRIRVAVLWHKGERDFALKDAKEMLSFAATMQVVKYTSYVSLFHLMEVIFLALELVYEQNHPQAEKDELMKYGKLSVKILRAYARVFTVGEPLLHRYTGWVEWYSGKKDKAYQSWRTACEKAHVFPMNFEEGLSNLDLARHLPPESAERLIRFEKAREAFARGSFENWVETTNALLGQNTA